MTWLKLEEIGPGNDVPLTETMTIRVRLTNTNETLTAERVVLSVEKDNEPVSGPEQVVDALGPGDVVELVLTGPVVTYPGRLRARASTEAWRSR